MSFSIKTALLYSVEQIVRFGFANMLMVKNTLDHVSLAGCVFFVSAFVGDAVGLPSAIHIFHFIWEIQWRRNGVLRDMMYEAIFPAAACDDDPGNHPR